MDEEDISVLDRDDRHTFRYATLSSSVSAAKLSDPLPSLLPKAEGKLRVVVISDTHNRHNEISLPPDADVLIHAGDFTNLCNVWEVMSFNKWLGEQIHIPHKFVVVGNHDRYQDLVVKPIVKNATLLLDRTVTVNGIRIHGGRFKLPTWSPLKVFGMSDRVARTDWGEVPEVDILVTHQPPGNTPFDFHRGNIALGNDIEARIKPRVHIFGHIHEGYGVYGDGQRTYICAASLIGKKKTTLRPPIVFDI
eukprot:TRINITY_DN1963_c0_g3_i2.p1 TRINITY_DN1963_c0_g3~~TRINITY_DN1963_c0_g3_i2.p1  ORF type:complete len:249 (-),score=26.41 TRINITY_DN1963_c0_g3_i2:115-861(-)